MHYEEKINKKSTKEIRAQIIEIAKAHFAQYGFNKTTMLEIAEDSGMSVGNIYRFFKNKADLGVEITSHFHNIIEEELKKIVYQPELSVSEKLQKFFLILFDMGYNLCENKPRIFELVDYITKKRMDLLLHFKVSRMNLLCELLAEGNRTGQLKLLNVQETAESIFIATLAFHALPVLFMGFKYDRSSKEMKEQKVKNVINLLVNGLDKEE